MSADHTPERRKKPRIPRRLPVRFGSEAKMAGGTVVDISESGLRIETSDPFPTNSTITVFVQFPRHSVRLRARVVWCGGKESGKPGMGLAFTRPEPALARSYAEWAAEVRLAAKEEVPAGDAGPAAATDAGGAAAAPAGGAGAEAAGAGGNGAADHAQPVPAAPRAPEPRGPVRRSLESRQGTVFEGNFERCDEGWHLTVYQVPRQAGVQAPDLSQDFPTYAAAEAALLAFVRSR